MVNSIFFFHGILCDTSEKSRGKKFDHSTTFNLTNLAFKTPLPLQFSTILLLYGGCGFFLEPRIQGPVFVRADFHHSTAAGNQA